MLLSEGLGSGGRVLRVGLEILKKGSVNFFVMFDERLSVFNDCRGINSGVVLFGVDIDIQSLTMTVQISESDTYTSEQYTVHKQYPKSISYLDPLSSYTLWHYKCLQQCHGTH